MLLDLLFQAMNLDNDLCRKAKCIGSKISQSQLRQKKYSILMNGIIFEIWYDLTNIAIFCDEMQKYFALIALYLIQITGVYFPLFLKPLSTPSLPAMSYINTIFSYLIAIIFHSQLRFFCNFIYARYQKIQITYRKLS